MISLPSARACDGPDAPALAGAMAPAARSGERSEPLPCLNRNNSNETVLNQAISQSEFQLSPYQRKALFALTENIAKFIQDVGIERIGFLTLTFENKIYDIGEASAHFNRLNVRVLKEYFGGWCRVIEQHKDGAWHYHLLVEMPCDIRTGFDFTAFNASKEEYQRHGNSGTYYKLLRAATGKDHPLPPLWKELWERLQGYSFGRFELVPVRTNQDGISKYLAKYLSKGLSAIKPDGRRVRLWAISRNVQRAVRMPFAWVSTGARLWRRKVTMVAERFRCRDFEDIRNLAGPSWAYHLKDLIASLIPDGLTLGEFVLQHNSMEKTGFLGCTIDEGPDGKEVRHAHIRIGVDQVGLVNAKLYDAATWNNQIYREISKRLPRWTPYNTRRTA